MTLPLLLLLHGLTVVLSYSSMNLVKRIPLILTLSLLITITLSVSAFQNHDTSHLLSFSLLTLVELLSIVIFSFAYDYLDGEKNRAYFLRLLLSLTSCVVVLLLSQSILAVYLSWVVVGLLVNKLLLFYPHRPHTHTIAHKQFVNDMIANLLMAIGLFGLAIHYNSWSITTLSHALSLTQESSVMLYLLIIAVAFMLKTAIMPFHGWLIQVMEVPTPVSAFMHAGVVNLSGMMWLRLYPWWTHYVTVREVVAIMALISLILSSIVMLTRVSIKVRLAWSTTAQMSFLLIECAQGWYEMAFIHLLGHSLYKAQAFLLSGHRVHEQPLKQQLKERFGEVSARWLSPLLAFTLSILFILLAGRVVHHSLGYAAISIQQSLFLALLLSPGLWLMKQDTVLTVWVKLIMQCVFITVFMMLHVLLHPVIPTELPLPSFITLPILFILAVTYLIHWLIMSHQMLANSSRLNTLAYEGFYLDTLWTNWVSRPVEAVFHQPKQLVTNALGRVLNETL
ncbi:hypothetical protein LHV13_04085 [Ferrovum sp. PN-J185]|uniref:proton-conducting transporter transmembrane domain-containing protein n=1 Tax=Ferrovum sp. PN-J185 TaxID=1356306 RepID=UPI000794B193|nr:proton-conducting transporter membrane subunit [Ferrovum sp. PN-J185]KXW56594.1 NADH-quinone oxidoreductase subunit L [Ferrovum sp. PN-J185]MCC6068357.1 hypothetical protein [Ferrovum sp. PN-J185]